jgi:tetratricopeptide (TPR) repeat protein
LSLVLCVTRLPPGSACQASAWKEGHNKECKCFAAKAWNAQSQAATDCLKDNSQRGLSRENVPVLDKAIKLSWTLRDIPRFPLMHLDLVGRRGKIEKYNDVGEEGRRRVSDLILRALRGLKWPPLAVPFSADDVSFHTAGFLALVRMHDLHGHEETAEEMLRARYHDLEMWQKQEGCAAESLATWTKCLLRAAHAHRCSEARREALVGEAKQVALVQCPFSGGPGVPVSEAARVRYGGWGRRRQVRRPHLLSFPQILAEVALYFAMCSEFELSVQFAQAEMALAQSIGQREDSMSLRALTHSLHMMGKLKEAEQHMRAYLLREGEDSLYQAGCLSALARVLRDQGRLGEALETAEQATALTRTIPLDHTVRRQIEARGLLILEACLMTEASILERMGRLKEAMAKDKLTAAPFHFSRGALWRMALWWVAEGKLEAARIVLHPLIFTSPDEDDWTNVEGPDVKLRAKELLCQVLHGLRGGGGNSGAGTEESALRAELRHEEARRGEALREVRALVRRLAGEEGVAEAAADEENDESSAVVVPPKRSRKKKKKKKRKGKRGETSHAAGALAHKDEGGEKSEEPTDAAAAAAALEVEDAAVAAGVAVAVPVGDKGPGEEAA